MKHDPGKRLCGTSAAIFWGQKSQESRLEMTVLEKIKLENYHPRWIYQGDMIEIMV